MTVTANISTLRAAKIMAEDQDWTGVLDATKDPVVTQVEPRLLRWRMLAAAATKNEEIVHEMAEACKLAELAPMENFAFVRELAQAGYYQKAISLLLGKAGLSDSPHFQISAQRLLKVTRSRADRIALRRAIDAASKGGSKIRPIAASYQFNAPDEGEAHRFGTVSLDKSSVTHTDHLIRLTKDRDQFVRLVSKRRPPRVVEYHNVFVNRVGQIWTADGAMIVQRGVAIPTTDISQVPVIDVAFNALAGTRGIYHWLVDRVPLLAGMNGGDPDEPKPNILLGDRAPGFEEDTLALLGFDQDRITRVGDALFVRRLVVAAGGMSTLADWSVFEPVLGPLIDNALEMAARHGVEFPERVYISRAAAKRRPMVNEEVIEDAARARGFTVLQFENIPLWHQIAVIHKATTIMAPHGAGLAHLLVARSGAKVIEILPIKRGDGTYFLRWNYARLSLVRGHTYSAWLEEQPVGSDLWKTQVDEFLPFLDRQLGMSQLASAGAA